MVRFPEGFFWGAATSAHQVEGNSHNDWSRWEEQNARRLAGQAEREFGRLASWPDIRVQAQDPANYISGRACEHFERFREDFDIAKELGHNAHRFSIEWSRIEPEEGKFDENAIEHYRQVVAALRERGIEPFVTLWHWALPQWLAQEGGVLNGKFPGYFARYAEKMVTSLSGVEFWLTLNETNVYTAHGYWKGIWPPGERSICCFLLANHRLSRAHKAAYAVIKKYVPSAHIGVAHNIIWFSRSRMKDYVWNCLFLNSIRGFQDFVGVNYYHSDRDTAVKTDMGWSVDPEGLFRVLISLKKYGKPLYVLENGIADSRDEKRAVFIRDHVRSIARAIAAGADVRGYFHWSLLDNFEWDKGFWPRFGLVEVDYKTLQRSIRPSAREYARIIENSGLDGEVG